MANVFEQITSLNDKVSRSYEKSTASLKSQQVTYTEVTKTMLGFTKTANGFGICLGRIRTGVKTLESESASMSKRVSSASRDRQKSTKMKYAADNYGPGPGPGSGDNRGNNSLENGPVPEPDPYRNLWRKVLQTVKDYVAGASAAYEKQLQAETGLAAAMRLSMGASDEEIESIKRLTSAQQSLGVISDQVQMSGAQQLATFVQNKGSIEALVPAMNNLLAQQKGLNATESDAANIGSMMGEAMKGNTSALAAMGVRFSAVQEQMIKYGDESERAAALAQAITDNVGEANRALAATPEGGLKKHANTMTDLQERIGKFIQSIKGALLPVFDVISGALEGVVSWFEQNQETITTVINTVSQAIGAAFSVIGSVIGGAIEFFGGWLTKLKEGNGVVIAVSVILGALGLIMAAFIIKAKVMAMWTKIVTTAKTTWATVQSMLNLSLLACPITWIVVGIIALIGVITYLCYKIDGWGSLWDGVVGFMKYSFMAFVDQAKLNFTALVNGIMMGIDMIKLGWYKAKDALGLGDSDENRAAIAQINADVEERQKAIADGAKKVAENVDKAKESLAGINMSWNSEKSLSDVTDGLKSKLGMGGPAVAPGVGDDSLEEAKIDRPALSPLGGAGSPTGGTGAGTSSAISSGGSRPSSVTINLKSLVETLSFGSYEGDRDTMQRDLESRLIRVLEMANSAM